MNGLRPRTIALYVSLVFIAGAIAGGAAGSFWQRKSAATQPPRHRDMSTFLMERMTEELSLTPDQVVLVEPIITNTTARIRQLQRDSGRQVEAAMKEANNQIRPLLSEYQQALMDAMEERHSRRWRDRPPGPGPHGPDRMPPGDKPPANKPEANKPEANGPGR